MEQVDCVVIGAGVAGIAVARALAQAGREVLVLEAAEGIGTETSSRNSEVIHAGIYYPHNSLMARLCVQGKWMLYDFCRNRGVAFANCGKLIVAATDEESEKLDAIRAQNDILKKALAIVAQQDGSATPSSKPSTTNSRA